MKIYLLLLVLFPLLLLSSTFNKNIIIGNITGLEKGDKVILTIGLDSYSSSLVDSVVVERDGCFCLETSVTGAFAHIFIVKNKGILDLHKDAVSFFIEGFSTMNIGGDIDDLIFAKTTGGLYDMQEMHEINKIMDSAMLLHKIGLDKYQDIQFIQENNVSQDSVLKLQEEARKWFVQSNKLYEKKMTLDSSFRENNPELAYSAYVLRSDYKSLSKGIEYFEALYNKLMPSVKSSHIGNLLGEYIAAKIATMVGAIAPDFKAKDIYGKGICLSDFKGKYILLEFWSTDCGPCLEATSYLVKMYEKLKGNNFEMVSIAIGERNQNHLIKVIANKKMAWRHINDIKGEIKTIYGIQAIPSCLLINPDGKIVKRGHPLILIPKVEKIILDKK